MWNEYLNNVAGINFILFSSAFNQIDQLNVLERFLKIVTNIIIFLNKKIFFFKKHQTLTGKESKFIVQRYNFQNIIKVNLIDFQKQWRSFIGWWPCKPVNNGIEEKISKYIVLNQNFAVKYLTKILSFLFSETKTTT